METVRVGFRRGNSAPMTGETLSHGRYTRSSLFRLLSFTTIRVSHVRRTALHAPIAGPAHYPCCAGLQGGLGDGGCNRTGAVLFYLTLKTAGFSH